MFRVHLRILAALFAMAVLAATVMGAVWLYREHIAPEKKAKEEVAAKMKQKGPAVDPGRKLYEQAIDLLRRGETIAAREKLGEVIDVYKDSARWQDSRAVLGEMNMDRLFSRTPMPGKLEYTVGRTRQDNLNAIAAKFRTTVPFIKRVNNLLGSIIHPGDRLVIYPLDFEVEVDLAARRLTVTRGGEYFKDYEIRSHHLPYPNLPAETTVGDVPGWVADKKVRADDERYAGAGKWLQTAGKGSRGGIIFCPEPPAPPEGQPPTPSGIYLAAEDVNELSTIIRPGVPLRFRKPGKS
jgi:LysM domain